MQLLPPPFKVLRQGLARLCHRALQQDDEPRDGAKEAARAARVCNREWAQLALAPLSV